MTDLSVVRPNTHTDLLYDRKRGQSNPILNQSMYYWTTSRFNQEMAVWLNKCYFIKLRGTKEVQECVSIGHLEISLMSSGAKPRNSRGTLKEPERFKRY